MKRFFEKLSVKTLAIGSLVSIGCYFLTSTILEGLYAKSKFSVSYFEAQTSFDASKLKNWYQELLDFDTLGIYYQTQYFDFVFITAVIAMGFFVWNLLGSLFPKTSWFFKNRFNLSIFLPLAGLFDVFENIVSFFMLANPTSFNNNLVYLYSGFASTKFLCWSIALIILATLIIALPIQFFLKQRKTKNV